MNSLGGLSLSRIYLELLLKPVYPTIAWKNCQIYVVEITGK